MERTLVWEKTSEGMPVVTLHWISRDKVKLYYNFTFQHVLVSIGPAAIWTDFISRNNMRVLIIYIYTVGLPDGYHVLATIFYKIMRNQSVS